MQILPAIHDDVRPIVRSQLLINYCQESVDWINRMDNLYTIVSGLKMNKSGTWKRSYDRLRLEYLATWETWSVLFRKGG